MPSMALVLAQVVVATLVEARMTAKDRQFGGRTITLDKGTAEKLEEFRLELVKELGCEISYRLAIAIAVFRAKSK